MKREDVSELVVGPLLRGLTYDGRAGRIVTHTTDDVPAATRVDLASVTDEVSLRSALADTVSAKVPVAVTCPGIGSFRIGPPIGAPMDRNGVVAGKVAIVTGGARGIGEELVRSLHDGGAYVCVADVDDDGARELVADLNGGSSESRAMACRVDVSDESSVEEMISDVVRGWGGVDILVSNAGVLVAGGVAEMDSAAFERVTRVNYTGFFLLTKHVVPVMRLQNLGGGYLSDIVQINSKSGLVGSSRNAAYAGSKFGGIGLTQSFALEVVEYGIKVNAICPGNYLDGPLWSDPDRGLFAQYLRAGKVPGATTIDDVRGYYEKRVPMGRGVVGSDIARALYYVVEQQYETGQAVPVSGGQVMLA